MEDFYESEKNIDEEDSPSDTFERIYNQGKMVKVLREGKT